MTQFHLYPAIFLPSLRLSFVLLHLATPAVITDRECNAFTLEANSSNARTQRNHFHKISSYRVPPLLWALRMFSQSPSAPISASVVITTQSGLHNTGDRQKLVCTASHLWCIQGKFDMYGEFNNVGASKTYNKNTVSQAINFRLIAAGKQYSMHTKHAQLNFYRLLKITNRNYFLY